MKVVLGQLFSSSDAPATNRRRLVEVLYRNEDADIAVFPELFLSGYASLCDRSVANQCVAELREIARVAAVLRTAVVVGLPMFRGRLRKNIAACIDESGELVATYEKVALFDTERRSFSPGNEVVVCRLAGYNVGPLICFDLEFPELARESAIAGAQVLVVVAANMEPFYRDHQLFSQVRALENRRPLIYVNQTGASGALTFVGGSRAVRDDGAVLLELPRHAEADGVVDVPVGRRADHRVDYLRQLVGLPVTRRQLHART
jgi:predicted amidohydrolase